MMNSDILTPQKVEEIVLAGRKLNQSGYAPANSGNYSLRLDSNYIAITSSGVHKGHLKEEDVLVIDYSGKLCEGAKEKKPSAETLLHSILYQLYPQAGAVLHTHSIQSTVLSRWYLPKKQLILENYELQKAFSGIHTHEVSCAIPIFANSQDMLALATEVKKQLTSQKYLPGFLIAGHGLYTWALNMTEALWYVEAFEFLFSCELELLRLKKGETLQ